MNQRRFTVAKLLLPHLPNCTKSTPCLACLVTAFVGETCANEDVAALAEVMRRATSIPSSVDPNESIQTMEFSRGVETRLARVGIDFKRDLLLKSEADLLKISGIGRKSVNEIKEALVREGMSLFYP